MTEQRPKSRHMEQLARHFPFAGQHLVDAGCGEGALVRALAKRGAKVVGLDPNKAQLEKARAEEAVAGERFVEAGAENLPFETASQDGVIFFNSLHHLPLEAMDRALEEAARVLRPGGLLYVLEPLAEGACHEALAPIDDETFVRAKAEEALQKAAAGPAYEPESREEYLGSWKVAGYEAMKEEMIRIDPARKAAFEAGGDAIRADFLAAVDDTLEDGSLRFWLPYRATVLRRAA